MMHGDIQLLFCAVWKYDKHILFGGANRGIGRQGYRDPGTIELNQIYFFSHHPVMNASTAAPMMLTMKNQTIPWRLAFCQNFERICRREGKRWARTGSGTSYYGNPATQKVDIKDTD